jgi:integrase
LHVLSPSAATFCKEICAAQWGILTWPRVGDFGWPSGHLLGPEEIRTYQVYLSTEKNASPSLLNQAVCALRFLYRITLAKTWMIPHIPYAKKPRKLPVVLSRDEVSRFFESIPNLKHRAIVMTAYATGLRVSEVLSLRVSDIDSERMMIRVEQGKGRKDRLWAAAHKRSYVPEKVMCSGAGQSLRRQSPGSDCPAHNYLPLNEAMSLSAGRKRPRLRLGGRTASSISRFCEGSARRYPSVL